jgi:hypothetical protein
MKKKEEKIIEFGILVRIFPPAKGKIMSREELKKRQKNIERILLSGTITDRQEQKKFLSAWLFHELARIGRLEKFSFGSKVSIEPVKLVPPEKIQAK